MQNLITKNFCINLDRRPDRWQKMQNVFSTHNLKVHRWTAIDSKEYGITNHQAVLHNHINILYFCNRLNINNVLIFEDDIILCHNFKNTLSYIMTYLPEDWDALSLHCFKAKTKKLNKYICKLESHPFGSHGILINKKGIEKMLNFHSQFCMEDTYFRALDHYYAVNLEHTMAFQTGEDTDIPETSVIDEYKNFYNQYKYLHS